MQSQTQAKIYLASERGHTETDWFRSYNTFNFGRYKNPNKQAFAGLYVWNDDTIAGGRSIQLSAVTDSLLFMLPVVGGICYKDSAGNEVQVEAGESFTVFVKKNVTVVITNPYNTELVNVLHGWLKTKDLASEACVFSFSLEKEKNELIKATQRAGDFAGFIGRFDGRKEGAYQLSEDPAGVFVFVIQGAFEVQNRLLEARDGLALWNLSEIEFEALSNEAILLLLELPLR